MKYILSIDGGGIRGCITSCALVELEKQTGKLCRDIFSFVAGTSTGAMIAAAIAAGIPATTILELYTMQCAKVFNHPPAVALALRLARGWAYEPANLQRTLQSVLGAAANWTLNDSPIKILLTAKGCNKAPLYFVPDNPKNANLWGKQKLIDCTVASASATTYFDAWPVPGVGPVYDGGLGVSGNPVHQAAVEAFYYDDYDRDTTRIISLGTGYTVDANTKPIGLPAELAWLLDALLTSPEGEQTGLVNRYYPGIMQRFDWQLESAIDMADVAAIPGLVTLGKKVAAAMDWKTILAI